MTKKSSILIDTCILSNLISKEEGLANKTKQLLKKLYEEENEFYISEFSRYELLRGANEKQRKKAHSILKEINLTIVPNTTERLDRATALYTAYNSINNIKNSLHSISDVDIFIGSLIFTNQKPYLLTADYFDFPRPFFIEAERWTIDFKKKKGNRVCSHYYLLQADLELLFK